MRAFAEVPMWIALAGFAWADAFGDAKTKGAPIRFDLHASFRYESLRGLGTGVSAGDFDNDGDVDLFVPTGAGVPHLLLENDGGGNFRDVAEERGLGRTAPGRVALWIDGNGDGRLDLLVGADDPGAGAAPGQRLLQFHVQGEDGTFADRSDEVGFGDEWIRESGAHLGGLCAGDVNNDGFPDLYVTLWHGAARLYVNHRNGTFKNVVGLSRLRAASASWQPIMADIDDDGWIDIYEARDQEPNALWLNQRDLTFRDGAFAAGADNSMNDMGIAVGDIDNDGDFDFYVTAIERPAEHAVLLRNDSDASRVRYSEIARAAGVASCGWGWGCTFLDADSDGWLDLAVTNGWYDDAYRHDRSRVYRNSACENEAHEDVSETSGFNDALWGSSLISADVNNDGAPDLVQTCLVDPGGRLAELRVLMNVSGGNGMEPAHWLKVRPRMSNGANRFALGAVVRVKTDGGREWSRLITAGISFLGQEPAEAAFGLGAFGGALSVTVEWPDGSVTSTENVLPDQTLSISVGNPNRSLFFMPRTGHSAATPRLLWHGGVLEEWVVKAPESHENRVWRRLVPQPPNPFPLPSPNGPNSRIFRVSDDF